ncbi:MAG: RnfABCDGE type electron transport complex subunit B [Gammaproteobacteria bacterium]|nr:RnfABCDGE type electron transport complex subunit B [Gammaproteobacteria bacterium]
MSGPEKITHSLDLVEEIDAWLPQTQCGQCGYPRCWDYARAIAGNQADINQCPPGDSITITGLARLLNKPVVALNTAFGVHRPRTLAVIKESLCIGCTLCIQACPVDAIVGSAKLMHTVIAQECTGCELCLPPCPMDCIELVPYASHKKNTADRWPEYSMVQTDRARNRINARILRLQAEQKPLRGRHHKQSAEEVTDPEKIRREIQAALVRVKAKKQNR